MPRAGGRERVAILREPGADAVARALAADDAHFPAKLHGHFGLAAWNPGSRILRLARDPLGTRTLYCFRNPERGIAIFASELKAVLAHASVAPRIDPDSRWADPLSPV